MADIVGVGAPVDFHFGEDIGLIDSLHLGDGLFNRLPLGRVELRILSEVKTIELCRNPLARFFPAGINDAEDAHGLPLDKGKAAIDKARQQSRVDRAIRVLEDVTRPVVAVYTIHSPDLQLLHLIWGQRGGAVEVLGYSPLVIFHSDPRDFLSLGIGGAVVDLVGDIHVPVDARGDPGRGAASAGAQQASDLAHAVLLVVAESCDDL